MPIATSYVGCYILDLCLDGLSYTKILLRFLDIVHYLVFCRITVCVKQDLLCPSIERAGWHILHCVWQKEPILITVPVSLLFQTEYIVLESQHVSVLRWKCMKVPTQFGHNKNFELCNCSYGISCGMHLYVMSHPFVLTILFFGQWEYIFIRQS